ncbi:hypothetical protein [Exiguobacterium sp. 17-1]|uniref:hypothetical protein n=1 Tax=Exiguobacterium TaxID=33986 RepID=UPI001FFE514A|nr:hypothetical protein [Exiguobacterium sp. 17-1]MCK2157202.1 hypothetical protein [Exiguobacterium sp. 17-1]
MKHRMFLLLFFLLGLGGSLFYFQTKEAATSVDMTPQLIVKTVQKQQPAVTFSTKQVYWIEPLGDRHLVAFVKTPTMQYLILLKQTTASYQLVKLIRQTPQSSDWFEGRLLEVDQHRFLVVYGENPSRKLDTLMFDPYKVTSVGTHERTVPLTDIKRTLDVGQKDSFHTIQALPKAFPRSLFFDIHAVDHQGDEQLRRLSNTLD